MTENKVDLRSLTADVVIAHLSNNRVALQDVPELIQTVHQALEQLDKPVEVEQPKPEPVVSIRASIKPDYIVCLEDGAKLKMLKRYLHTHYGMTPDQYREKWDLPKDYPMVAPAYAAKRKELAKAIGLGRNKVAEAVEGAEQAVKGAATSVADSLQAARAHLGGGEAEPARKRQG